MHKKMKRAISILLALMIIIGALPAYAAGFPDDTAEVGGFEVLPAAYTITEHKYFLLSEHPKIFPLSDGVLGAGGRVSQYYPMIPDGREFFLEFVEEMSQEIRLELWSATPGATPSDPPVADEYLGLIAKGFA